MIDREANDRVSVFSRDFGFRWLLFLPALCFLLAYFVFFLLRLDFLHFFASQHIASKNVVSKKLTPPGLLLLLLLVVDVVDDE